MYGVTITELINKMGLKNLTPELDTDKIVVAHPEVNRPALQLTGFYSHFDNERVQMLGNVEIAYLQPPLCRVWRRAGRCGTEPPQRER